MRPEPSSPEAADAGAAGDEGWSRRFVVAPTRVAEARALYEALGYEVRLEPLPPGELPITCGDCVIASSLFKVIYTRRST